MQYCIIGSIASQAVLHHRNCITGSIASQEARECKIQTSRHRKKKCVRDGAREERGAHGARVLRTEASALGIGVLTEVGADGGGGTLGVGAWS